MVSVCHQNRLSSQVGQHEVRLGCWFTSSTPKGKIPYILLDNEGSSPFLLADSALIIRILVELDVMSDLNSSLEPAAKTQDMAIHALLEDKFYFYGLSIPHVFCLAELW
ncbi:hypothetical protein OCU04_002205 [Sclerotinia nivalis]|uniref:Thioredoxin-like fold domain-containing protein n=1 Tax=Sclerotinia nivalis TaxID=352851 RepID=A0A9X0DS65_9HELO|nr:hypothetical protein OCU04_002205 [Sclerotinia nivalis]